MDNYCPKTEDSYQSIKLSIDDKQLMFIVKNVHSQLFKLLAFIMLTTIGILFSTTLMKSQDPPPFNQCNQGAIMGCGNCEDSVIRVKELTFMGCPVQVTFMTKFCDCLPPEGPLIVAEITSVLIPTDPERDPDCDVLGEYLYYLWKPDENPPRAVGLRTSRYKEKNYLNNLSIQTLLKIHKEKPFISFISQSEIKINLNGFGTGEIELYNLTGRKIESIYIKDKATEISINISDYTTGIYFIFFNTNQEQKVNLKFIKS